MATLNLSTNGPSISKSYQTVIDSPATSAARSPTHGQWAVFSVSTPLINAFQQDAGNKESILKVQCSGEGELADLLDEFSEGKIQFAFVKVTDPNTTLPKNVLIAWCGEGVPERTKGYFTSHLSAVSKFLRGYHVQITARADGDITPEGIIQKVGDASGSKYSSESQQPVASAPRPPIATKPVFTPSRTGGLDPKPLASAPRGGVKKNNIEDDDGWGPDAPPVTRTELEKVQPAYKPTRVDMQQLRSSEKSPAGVNSSQPVEHGDVVKGGYQPVGKVDIAAIRRQAREQGELRDERPEPIRGAYEPVGKVDIAAIRSKAQKPNERALPENDHASAHTSTTAEPTKSSVHSTIPGHSERLTSLPKPKVSSKFVSASPFTATKPPVPNEPAAKTASSTAQIGSASRAFADQGGKTPAQVWAERKAKERGQDTAPNTLSTASSESPIQAQNSGHGGWKSSYSGKNWAPVQTTHTGKSAGSNASQHTTEFSATETPHIEPQAPQHGVSAIRDQLAHGLSSDENPVPLPNTSRTVPLPGGPAAPAQEEPPRSPSPPEREASPIRVAMPIGRGVTNDDDQQPAHQAAPTVDSQQSVPNEVNLDAMHDTGLAAESTSGEQSRGRGNQALVQYDYEKAEDNEIELREGEYVTNIEMVDQDWWLGSNSHGERGLFPSNYVELVDNNHHRQSSAASVPEIEAQPSETLAPSASSTANGPLATALYDYEAAEDNELSFPEGADITNIEFPDDDWWLGEYNHKRGLFPANYVQLEGH